MERRIYLHIGLNKTASTTIQHALHQNRSRLKRSGWYVPKTGSVSPRNAAQHNIAWEIRNNKRFQASKGTKIELKNETSEVAEGNIILTSECFGFFPKKHIEQLSEFLFSIAGKVIVIVYLRRQDDWFSSWWSQRVKQGMTGQTLRNWIKSLEVKGDFYRVINPWANVFGKENLRVRVLERSQLHGTVFSDFLKTCDIPNTDSYPIPESKNISPGVKTCEVMRFLATKFGEAPRPPDLRMSKTYRVSRFVREYAKLHGWDDVQYSLIDKETYGGIMEIYRESNQKIAREFFGRDELFLEPFEEKPTFSLQDISGEEMLDLMASLIKQEFIWVGGKGKDLEQDMDEKTMLKKKNKRLRSQLNAMRESRGWKLLEKYRRIRQQFRRN